MAELTFKSAGVSTREIDLSGPTAQIPQGTPAGVIGTSLRGPAFVPITFATYQDFVAIFGGTDGKKFGPLAVNEWMKNANAGAYVKVLGAGNCKRKNTTSGIVTNAGFVVGSQLVQANGNVGQNPYANPTSTLHGLLGRTYFLGAFMSESAGSTIFTEAGIKGGGDAVFGRGYTPGGSTKRPTAMSSSVPIIRGVLMAPSGVMLALSSTYAVNNRPQLINRCSSKTADASGGRFGAFSSGLDAGSMFGAVDTTNSRSDFTILLNGHQNSDRFPSLYTASFDPNSPNYFPNVLNTDPFQAEQAGHLLYASWDIYPQYAVVTGSGLTAPNNKMGSKEIAAFVVTSSYTRNAGTATSATTSGFPNYEGFETRFSHAKTPWITSQDFGGKPKNLFKLHALDDGAYANTKLKISVENIAKSNSTATDFGTFDLLIRDFYDTDRNSVVLERYSALSIDPGSDRYVGRIIGDMNTFYDFDKKAGRQKLVIDGLHPNRSSYVRVEMAQEVNAGRTPKKALPVGHRGYFHLVTSGSGAGFHNYILTGSGGGYYPALQKASGSAGAVVDGVVKKVGLLSRMVQPPVPMRRTLAIGVSPKQRAEASLYWGAQFQVNDSRTEPNKTDKFEQGMKSFTKYFPEYSLNSQPAWVGNNEGILDAGGTIFDADRFDNNRFSLMKIQVVTASNDTPHPKYWNKATYRRDGKVYYDDSDLGSSTVPKSRFLDVAKDFGTPSARKYLKYSLFLQGGFDGLNIFDRQKFEMTNVAVKREIDDSTLQGGTFGSTVAAYRKAIDVMEEKSDVDIQLLAIPGLRHESVTDYAIDAMEDRFDAMYIMDVEERDTYNQVVTSSVTQRINVNNTVNAFAGRGLDSSFAAVYFPDVILRDPTTRTNMQVPPSVAVLGAYALNDAVAHPWFAPAGFTRGALASVLDAQVKLNRDNLDELYDADVNPLATFPQTAGVVVWGQKTLMATQSALDRVNVRRLLIEVRRQVKAVANNVLFEPNRADTLARFSAAVNPILGRIQQQQGVDRFKVIIDTTTTTQADIENNTIRGKIFLQPTRTLEFVSLDFVVTNAGAQI